MNNSQNNFDINGYYHIDLLCGDIRVLQITVKYNIVLANINRNVLLDEIPFYVSIMKKNSIMLLSGFYEVDKHLLTEKISSMGMSVESKGSRNDWALLKCSLN